MALYNVFRRNMYIGSFAQRSEAEEAIREDICEASCHRSRSEYEIQCREVKKHKQKKAQQEFLALFAN